MKIKKDLSQAEAKRYIEILYDGVLLWKDMWERNLVYKEDSYYFSNVESYTLECSFCELFYGRFICPGCPLDKPFLWRCKWYSPKRNFPPHYEVAPSWLRKFYAHRIYKIHVKIYLKYRKFYGV
jgi:hypothetical protein